MLDERISRRTFLKIGAAAAGVLLVPPEISRAGTVLVNPYSGAIPLVFPLTHGTYQSPVSDNWHASREGKLYIWSHRDAKTQRAHDGVDVYPSSAQALPTVYAPLKGTVAAVCLRSDNTLNATVTYKVSSSTPPPWDYSQAIDNVANLPLYGNFVWLYSTDANSAGYFVFFCHLQNEVTLQGLLPDRPVDSATPVGVMGDTGNAAGTPQLHVEIHYPSRSTYTCSHCKPSKSGMTSIDPHASLAQAALR
jgi:murein DD-endopeptidase MepM/ murein hydrolase activator NlpD